MLARSVGTPRDDTPIAIGCAIIAPKAMPGQVMVWGLTIVAVLAFTLAFTSHSPGLMGFGIALGLVCGIAAALIFIDRHVRASSRPEHMTPREIEALRNTVRKPEDFQRKLPPGSPH